MDQVNTTRGRQSGRDLANLLLDERRSSVSGKYWDGHGPKEIPSSKESYDQKRAEELWNWSSRALGLEVQI
jgi:hypothetical protein